MIKTKKQLDVYTSCSMFLMKYSFMAGKCIYIYIFMTGNFDKFFSAHWQVWKKKKKNRFKPCVCNDKMLLEELVL